VLSRLYCTGHFFADGRLYSEINWLTIRGIDYYTNSALPGLAHSWLEFHALTKARLRRWGIWTCISYNLGTKSITDTEVRYEGKRIMYIERLFTGLSTSTIVLGRTFKYKK